MRQTACAAAPRVYISERRVSANYRHFARGGVLHLKDVDVVVARRRDPALRVGEEHEELADHGDGVAGGRHLHGDVHDALRLNVVHKVSDEGGKGRGLTEAAKAAVLHDRPCEPRQVQRVVDARAILRILFRGEKVVQAQQQQRADHAVLHDGPVARERLHVDERVAGAPRVAQPRQPIHPVDEAAHDLQAIDAQGIAQTLRIELIGGGAERDVRVGEQRPEQHLVVVAQRVERLRGGGHCVIVGGRSPPNIREAMAPGI